MGGKIRLTGHITVPHGRLAEITLALRDHIQLTRQESGCETFMVAPCPQVSGRFLVKELFTDRAAFEHHQKRTRSSHWGEITLGFERSYDIEELAR